MFAAVRERPKKVDERKVRKLLAEAIEELGSEEKFKRTFLYHLLAQNNKESAEALFNAAFPFTHVSRRVSILYPLGYAERAIAKSFLEFPFSGRLLHFLVDVGGASLSYALWDKPSLAAPLIAMTGVHALINISRHFPSVAKARKELYARVKEECISRNIS